MGLPLKRLRRLFKQLEQLTDELVRIKADIELPDEEALSAMLSGRESLNSEAYLLAILHWTELSLEDVSCLSPLFRKRVLSNPFRRENAHSTAINLREMLANALWARRIDPEELVSRFQENSGLDIADLGRLGLIIPLLEDDGTDDAPPSEV